MLAHGHLRLHRMLATGLIVALLGGSCGEAPRTRPAGSAGGPSASAGSGPTAPAIDEPSGAPACASRDSGAAAPGSGAAAPEERPWWTDRVFYELFVRSFADSDGDGIGDLRGVIDRLDYLNDGDPATDDDLGVTGLWLMPVAEAASYHGYDVTDYRTIERDYGTNEDFRALVAEAHARGIAVVVDLVLNHTSREHPWFLEARKRGSAREDWYLWSDDVPFAGPAGRRVWHPEGDRRYYGYFWEGMPDLNVAHPDVTRELDAVARFWIEELGVDGFRLDAARHLIEEGDRLENAPATLAWLRGFRERLHAVRSEALVLGEVWDATSNAARYVREGSLDLTFDFGLAGAMLLALRAGDAETLAATQREVSEAYPPGGHAAFLTNHDQDRAFDQLGRDEATARAAATLLLTGSGVPFLYYGEEVGLSGRKPDERIRTPLPWDASSPGGGFTAGTPWQPLAPNAATANVAGQVGDPASLLAHYRALVGLRNAHPALRHGPLVPVASDTRGVYAYLRHDAGEAILVLVNLDDEPREGFALDLAAGPLCAPVTPVTLLGGQDLDAPAVNAAGGFDAWRPVPRLEPRETLVVRLAG